MISDQVKPPTDQVMNVKFNGRKFKAIVRSPHGDTRYPNRVAHVQIFYHKSERVWLVLYLETMPTPSSLAVEIQKAAQFQLPVK